MGKQAKHYFVAHMNHFIFVNIWSNGLKTVWFCFEINYKYAKSTYNANYKCSLFYSSKENQGENNIVNEHPYF